MKDGLEAYLTPLECSMPQIDVHTQNEWRDGTRPDIMVEAYMQLSYACLRQVSGRGNHEIYPASGICGM